MYHHFIQRYCHLIFHNFFNMDDSKYSGEMLRMITLRIFVPASDLFWNFPCLFLFVLHKHIIFLVSVLPHLKTFSSVLFSHSYKSTTKLVLKWHIISQMIYCPFPDCTSELQDELHWCCCLTPVNSNVPQIMWHEYFPNFGEAWSYLYLVGFLRNSSTYLRERNLLVHHLLHLGGDLQVETWTCVQEYKNVALCIAQFACSGFLWCLSTSSAVCYQL